MDIAKIRKKLKDTEAGGPQPSPEERPAEKPEFAASGEFEKNAAPECSTAQDGAEQDSGIPEGGEVRQPGVPVTSATKPKKAGKGARQIPEALEAGIAADVVEILTFRLLKEDFAFRISHLNEILRSQWVTRVPNVPSYILGVTSLRGKIIPVIDLKQKLHLSEGPTGRDRKGRILILNGPKGPVGAAVDRVLGVVRLAKSDILPPPSHLSEMELKFIEGIAVVDKRFVSIINMEETATLHFK
jgi:purine-binding chemotaxis protein CheW